MKILRLSVIALIVGIVVVTALLIREIASPAANVQISLSPKAAVADLNTGQKLHDGSAHLKPGKYTASITANGFTSAKRSFTVTEGKNLQIITVLDPKTQQARDMLANNENEQLYREQLSGLLYSKTSQLVTDTYPILSVLPHSGDGYTINYGASEKYPSDPRRQAVYISTDNDSYKARAINWIRYQGYNPDAYEIIYQSKDARD